MDSAFVAAGLSKGRCFGSKSRYRESRARHFFVPNARVFTRAQGQIWCGDLDLYRDCSRLERIARGLRRRLYVLPEHTNPPGPKLAFGDVERAALWHTGGRLPPKRQLVLRSGLRPQEIAFMLGVSKDRVQRPQDPYVSLQINHRLEALNDYLGPLARFYGFRSWGDWLRAPNLHLGNRSVWQALRAGGSIVPQELFPRAFQDPATAKKFWPAMMAGLRFTHGQRVKTEWPPNNAGSRRRISP